MENINYSRAIVSIQTKDGDVFDEPHDRILNIGNQNLKDFNERMKTNTVLDYDYLQKSFKINRTVNNARIQHLSREFLMELNRFITLDRHPSFDQDFIKKDYVEAVEKDFDKLQQEIRTGERFTEDGLTKRQKEEYLNIINEQIELRKDSYPKVVVNKSELIEICKQEINALCDDLSKELVQKKIKPFSKPCISYG